jgi:predicted chitinase
MAGAGKPGRAPLRKTRREPPGDSATADQTKVSNSLLLTEDAVINVTFDEIHSLAPNLATQYRDAFQAHNISQVLRKYEISNTALRVCHFFAQVLTQTGALTSLTENLNYSAEDLMRIWPLRFPSLASAEPYAHDQVKLGNYLYEERVGNTIPGDGFLFRGRGLLQITGRSAYTHIGQQLNFDLAGEPDQAFAPTHCLEVAAAEWAVSGSGGKSCNALADDDNLEGVARAMDGALTGFEERRSWLAKTKSVWLSTPQPASRAIANMGVVDAAPAPLVFDAAAAPAPAPRRAAAFDPKQATLLGQFVEAAYSMFDADPTKLTPPASPDFPAGFRLAASIQMQDFVLFSTGPVFYGFVAQSTANLNHFVLAFRGTSGWTEWWDDANAGIRVPFRVPGCGWIGAGFARIYDTIEVVEYPVSALAASASARSLKSVGGLSRQIATLVARHAPAAGPTAFAASAAVSVAGHSLGSALATLYVMENAKTDQLANPLVYTFASPRVGDASFAAAFNGLGLTSWRVANAPDLVPNLPPDWLGFKHVDTLYPVTSTGKVKSSPGCWHSLATHLSLIDPTLQPSADCRLAPLAAGAPAAAAPLRTPPFVGKPTAAASQTTHRSIKAGPVTINLTIEGGEEV